MLYTELLELWDESVQAMNIKDWQGALNKLEQITEPTSRTLFNTASAHLALGQLDLALQALDLTICKDERLAIAFFQRGAVMMQIDRLEEALSDCIWAQEHMRGNVVIDYRQLGLQFKLYSWQVLYNTAAVYCRMGQWDQANKVLLSANQERGGGRGGNIEVALDNILRKEVLVPVLVPGGVVFRPKKEDVKQLQQRDFLGKAKVISSMIPNDDFGGFEPLRPQKPGFYEPKVDGARDSRYMRLSVPYVAQEQGHLTVPRGAVVFLLAEEDRDGIATVIYDGQRGLLPVSVLEPIDVRISKGKKENKFPNGIPFPPGLMPPTRPRPPNPNPAPPPRVQFTSGSPPPSYTTATHKSPASELPNITSNQTASSAQLEDVGSVVVKVHYTYTVALSVPLNAPYHEVKEQIAHKLGQPTNQLRLRHKPHGSQVLIPLSGEVESGPMMQDVAEGGRVTLWCQKEDPLTNYTILYQMVALYDYMAQGPEDLEFSEGDTIDILGEVNEEWLEGHCAGTTGIFPSSFAYRENANINRGQAKEEDDLQYSSI
ncbi:NADPH oxidase activator 1 [Solea solea]|uniref:NADPH oxidase activator 1 n=1 Tax=Solea solea TaxID=90069 RepID=UPI002729ADB8|nr:NADPH oxidase activator 1 [Solea solea]